MFEEEAMNRKIFEARDVNIYKGLLRVLGDYTAEVPCTGVDKLLDSAIEQGKKILPSDKRALSIIDYILVTDSTPAVVQKLLNMRFSDLPVELKPLTKDGRKHVVAFWMRGKKISDKVKDLIDFDGIGGKGQWVNIDGEAVTLIDKEI